MQEKVLYAVKTRFMVTKKHRIAFLCQDNPTDQRTWSGITSHLYKQISAQNDVVWIHANDLSKIQRRILSIWNRLVTAAGWKFTSHHFLQAFFLGKRIQKKIKNQSFDFLVVGAGESELIAHLRTEVPIIYIADTTFRNMVDYYPWHTGLSRLALIQGDRVERKAIHNATHIVYSSQWAANSALEHYKAELTKISVLSFGANLMHIPSKEALKNKKSNKPFRLLFLGVQWERKGGPLVHQTLLELKRRNLEFHLTVIGCKPDLKGDENICIIPFLDKNDKSQSAKLYDILMETDLLFVPTRADCTPVVFSEAAAFGIPVITTDTGGVTGVIKEGINGYCLSIEATAVTYADRIESLCRDKILYSQLRVSARREYDTRLNWQIWTEKFNAILELIKEH